MRDEPAGKGPPPFHSFRRGGVTLRGSDTGAGRPVLFCHGFGADEGQAAEAFPVDAGARRLTPEWRGPGGSEGGTERPFSMAMLAADALAFLDTRGVGAVLAGGVSLGAAIALLLAVRHPARVEGLILVRPAWLFGPAPSYVHIFADIAAALRRHPAPDARAAFARSATARELAATAPLNLKALLGFFDAPDPALMADLCDDLATADPGVTRAEVAALRLPALVVGHAGDAAHPLETARTLAETIPGARLATVPPRQDGKAESLLATRAAIAAFLRETSTAKTTPNKPGGTASTS